MSASTQLDIPLHVAYIQNLDKVCDNRAFLLAGLTGRGKI